MKRALLVLAAALALLLAVLGVRTARFDGRQPFAPAADKLAFDSTQAAARLAGAIRIPTISDDRAVPPDRRQLLALHAYLQRTFPRAHATLGREVVGDSSLLYTWRGRDSTRPAILLAAHLDVVPIEAGTEARWAHPPFGGEIAGGFIWGRGALDDKAGLVGILEAVEALVAEGVQPRRTVYLAFGHDEEMGGDAGARRIAALLATRRVPIDFVLDEGGGVLVDVVPGVRAPVAAVGIAEKGSVSLTLTVEAPGGHASMPPDRTAIGILSRAIERLQAEPFPASLGGATGALFDFVGPEAELPYRAALANRWLFGPLIKRRLMASPSTAAEVRTTVAATQIEGGTKRNALPGRARATLNVRILPGWTVADVTDRVRRVVNDPRVRIAVSGDGTDPSPLAPVDSPGFQEIAVAIRQVYPDAVVAPYLVVGQTDGRHYTAITRNVYRFGPGRLGPLDLERLHGSNERIGVADYAAAVRFYAQLLRNATR